MKEPVYSIKSNNLISGSAAALENLNISYKKRKVENLNVAGDIKGVRKLLAVSPNKLIAPPKLRPFILSCFTLLVKQQAHYI